MEPPSRAEEFFKRVTNNPNPVDFLKGLVNSAPPTEESEWLDFVSADNLSDNSANENWSKALSGFANTEGGVLIWGIKARRTQDVIVDRASALALAPDCASLRARLKDRLPFLTDPPVRGVEAIEYPVFEKSGFVLCYVPRSSFKPHRAETHKRFYIRITDDFKEPSVTWLRRMFEPELRPDLRVSAEISGVAPAYKVGPRCRVQLFIRNDGVATAVDPFVIIRTPPGAKFESDSPWKRLPVPGVALSSTIPIHPRQYGPLVTLLMDVVNSPLEIVLNIFAQHQQPVIASLVVWPEQQTMHSSKELQIEPLVP
jgi:hypothetical protein